MPYKMANDLGSLYSLHVSKKCTQIEAIQNEIKIFNYKYENKPYSSCIYNF